MSMQVSEISKEEYEVGIINSIAKKEGALRNKSKAPTFRLNLPRDMDDPGEELRVFRNGSKGGGT